MRYFEDYLEQDMKNQGYLLEHILEICKGIDLEWFIETFMTGLTRSQLDEAHPKLINEAAEDLFDHFIFFDLGEDKSKIRRRDRSYNFSENELYWIGWMYAYIQYEADMSSKRVYEAIPFRKMLSLYKLGHEMSKEAFFDKIKNWLK